jgi:uncharacterized membrane protein
MSEYVRMMVMNAPAEEIFRYVSSASNVPTFVPHVHSAEAESDGRLRVRGVANGREFETSGFVNIDAQRHRMEWGADGSSYRGWLEVRTGDATPTLSEVTLHLSVPDRSTAAEGMPADQDDERMQGALMDALNAIRRQVERELPSPV